MPTLLDYFNNDFPSLTIAFSLDNRKVITWKETNQKGKIIGQSNIVVLERIHLHGLTSTRLPTYYVPAHINTLDIIFGIIAQLGINNPNVLDLDMIASFTGDIQAGLQKTKYTTRLYIYTETPLKSEEVEKLHKFCKPKGLFITLRSIEYLNTKISLERPKAFISHDSRDKALIAQPIAKGLASRLCPIWYDEFSLKIGDSLRESIELGIKETNKCILILTPHFLKNSGWGKKEFNSVFTKEMITNERVVLPIWYNVTAKDVYEYSPALADNYALTWPSNENKSPKEYDEQVEEVISSIHTAITK